MAFRRSVWDTWEEDNWIITEWEYLRGRRRRRSRRWEVYYYQSQVVIRIDGRRRDSAFFENRINWEFAVIIPFNWIILGPVVVLRRSEELSGNKNIKWWAVNWRWTNSWPFNQLLVNWGRLFTEYKASAVVNCESAIRAHEVLQIEWPVGQWDVRIGCIIDSDHKVNFSEGHGPKHSVPKYHNLRPPLLMDILIILIIIIEF